MELLAPAGNRDHFFAAIEAGADAVYCGLDSFNARLRAKNFTPAMLSSMVPFARKKSVRIYVTLNTLIKETELRQAIDVLYQLDQIGVDGIITADLGLIAIARKWFPRLALHASTQMFVHNSPGAAMAAQLGMTRVILARELTLDEIESIARKCAIELEVFVHGALCYSFSGVCLASSFAYGSSGNRGRCSQICRRAFKRDGLSGRFFSANDLMALEQIPRFKRIGIASLKIEGRMRSAEYVHAAVSLYRRAIDDPSSIANLAAEAAADLGRTKSSFFLKGVRQEGIIQTGAYAGTGIYLGIIKAVKGNTLVLATNEPLTAGDHLRIHPQTGFEGMRAAVTAATGQPDSLHVTLDSTTSAVAGDGVFLVSRKAQRTAINRIVHGKLPPSKPIRMVCPFTPKILGSMKHSGAHARPAASLMVRIDSPAWLPLLDTFDGDGIIVAFEAGELRAESDRLASLSGGGRPLFIEFPPFISESDCDLWKTIAGNLRSRGIRGFAVSNPGQRLMVDKKDTVVSAPPVWVLNRAAQHQLADLGISRFVYSPEDEYLNLRNAASGAGMVCLFGMIPLFISRIEPSTPAGTLRDETRGLYRVEQRHGLHYLLSSKPLCLFHKRARLEQAGINSFLIDLAFCDPDRAFIDHVLECYRSRTAIESSTPFNFKLGLK